MDSDCQCDISRGRQIDQQYGDRCYLQKSPCRLLNGRELSQETNWSYCERNSIRQINCPGKKSSIIVINMFIIVFYDLNENDKCTKQNHFSFLFKDILRFRDIAYMCQETLPIDACDLSQLRVCVKIIVLL